jgi:hypothetical protein
MQHTAGATALGPSTLTAVALCGKKGLGSNIVVCTDGLANKGLGSFTGANSNRAEEFYERLGQFAKKRGVTINLISIAGAECNVQSLSKMC